ncbi:MAG: CAP domain-containing protein, partial [Polyangia bacterium]|nr:CAP domain-containing protein [Polyangia bacterium]
MRQHLGKKGLPRVSRRAGSREAVLGAALLVGCVLALGLALGPACVPEPSEGLGEGLPTEQATRAAGEVVDGIPTYEERTVLHMTNRIRAGMDCGDASLVCGGAPLRPVQWEHNLGRAAHFYARHLHDARCFQHQTCCFLENVGGVVQCDSQGYTCPGGACDYTPDCPGTPTFTRISMFGGSAVSENIAAGNSTAEATICQWYFSSGHHDNICTASRGSLGTGHYGGSNCYGSYWVQNFGSNALSGGLASGSHWGSGASLTFGAAFYDPSPTGPPERTAVVIDGACHNLTLEYGNNTSATYAASISVTSGCHAYYFLFTSSGGTRYTYPTTGSYLLGSGCGIYTADQAGADCEGGTGNCVNGETRPCYTGSAATRGVGACQDGTETCVGGTWGSCAGQVLPSAETCDGADNDCNGTVDDPCDCSPGTTRPCGTSVGECSAGT